MYIKFYTQDQFFCCLLYNMDCLYSIIYSFVRIFQLVKSQISIVSEVIVFSIVSL